MKMSISIPVSVQTYVLSNINDVSATDTWLYGISKTWVNKFRESLAYESDEGKSLTTDAVPSNKAASVGPLYVELDNNSNQMVSEKWWDVLSSWFGVKQGCSTFRRPTHSKYIQVSNGVDQLSVLARCELDLLTVEVCRLSDIDKDSNECILMYAWDSFKFLEHQIRRKFSISSSSRCRLWMYVKVNDKNVILDTIKDVEDAPVMAELAKYLSWLFKTLSERDQLDPEDVSQKDPFLLHKHNTKVCCAIEELDIGENDDSLRHLTSIKSLLGEGKGANAVTMATVDSECDQRLADCLGQLTKDLSDLTIDRTKKLVETASSLIKHKLVATDDLERKLRERIVALDEKEKQLNDRQGQHEDQAGELKKKLVQYKEGLDSFMKEKSRIETEWRRVREHNIIQDSQITLNVGGLQFNTSLSTVTSVDGSLFVDLFCGTHVMSASQDGSYFFDRDGTNFRYILNYLRNGSTAISSFPRDANVLREIQGEASYYRLSELVNLISDRIESGSVCSLTVDDMEILSH